MSNLSRRAFTVGLGLYCGHFLSGCANSAFSKKAKAERARKERAERFKRQQVQYDSKEKIGTIIINTAERFLYVIEENDQATRYGVGVGRTGFTWTGTAIVARKAKWPTWTPPKEMRERLPHLPERMEGGPNNPLGARALYLYKDGKDTLYRIHGTNEPWTIGYAVSSGCIRLIDEDIRHLYERTKNKTKVIVI